MSEFCERVQLIADRVGSAAELSRKTGISRRAIGTYLAGNAEPSREKLILLAQAAGVSVGWLAVGEASTTGDVDQPDLNQPPRQSAQGSDAAAEVRQMGTLGAQGFEWQVMRALLEADPDALTPPEIAHRLASEHRPPSTADIENYLAVLHRRGVVVTVGNTHSYRLRSRDGRLAARDLPDIYRATTDAMASLIDTVLPAVERQDGSGHLVQMIARLPVGEARPFLRALKQLVIDFTVKSAADEGGEEVRVMLAGVLEAEPCSAPQESTTNRRRRNA